MRRVDGGRVQVARNRIPIGKERVGFFGNACHDLGVGEQFVDRKCHRTAEIVSRDERRDEREPQVRLGHELRIGLVQRQ